MMFRPSFVMTEICVSTSGVSSFAILATQLQTHYNP